jgi:hypothetical protein
VEARNDRRRSWFRLAATLSALILFGLLIVCLGQFFPLTFRSSATVVVGLTPGQQSELIATFCTTAGREADSATGPTTLAGLIADSSLTYSARYRATIDLRVARSMMHAALAAEPQELTIAKMCETARHPLGASNSQSELTVSAATVAATVRRAHGG